MTRRLQLYCPQEYAGMTMQVVPCDRCAAGWDEKNKRCTIPTGVDHFPLVDAAQVPDCPLQKVCRHQRQEEGPCPVRARGFICESALVWGGLTEVEAADHPLSFHGYVTATPEDLELRKEDETLPV